MEVLKKEARNFLEDPHRISLEVPLAEGGDPHVLIYREEGKLTFELKGEVSPDLERKFKELGF